MKTHSPQNVIFSYKGNEPIGSKLVYLNKNPPSIEGQKPYVPEMHFETSCTNFPDNLIPSRNYTQLQYSYCTWIFLEKVHEIDLYSKNKIVLQLESIDDLLLETNEIIDST